MCVRARAGVCVCVCVCNRVMYSAMDTCIFTLGRGWGGGGGGEVVLFILIGMNVFGGFSLREPTCMHYVCLAL